MEINNVIIKHYLKNVMFINGTAYAGKSTMAKMLAERYGLIHCGENYDCIPKSLKIPSIFPNICYFDTMKDWQEFVNRPPDVYAKWLCDTAREIAPFEIAYLMRIAEKQKVIVDTNIPNDMLQVIADYHQVAVMLCPLSMSVGKFFDRDDGDKAFVKAQIMKAENPEKTMENFLAGITRYNQDIWKEFSGSGFFTLVREDTQADTREETLDILAKHFGLIG